jgi:hypothetical protein
VGVSPSGSHGCGQCKSGRSRNGKSLLQHRVRAEGGGCPENRPRFQQLPGLGRRRRRERDRGRQGPATASARCATCSIGNGASDSGCWRYLNVERSQSYEFCGAPSLPSADFLATLRITPVVAGDRAFVEWWASFDCEAGQRGELAKTLEGWFARWRIAPRRHGGVRPRVPTAEAYRRADNVAAAVVPGRFAPICQQNGLFGRRRTVLELLHSRSAFGIASPLLARDRRHIRMRV